MGDFGAGMTAKVLNNLLAASNTAMTRLVLDWADAEGVDEDKLLALIDASSGQNWLASGFNEIEFSRDGYASDNSIGILHKDVAAALVVDCAHRWRQNVVWFFANIDGIGRWAAQRFAHPLCLAPQSLSC